MIDTRLEYAEWHRGGHSAAAPELPAARHPGHGDRDLRHTAIAVALLALGWAAQARSEPSPLNARVVWVNDQRVYIASPDSLALERGDAITFMADRKVIAAGEITRIYERELAMATITSGSLQAARAFDRVQILVERLASRRSILRLGFPSTRRECAFFRCASTSIRPLLDAYRVDSLSDHSHRAVRTVEFPPCPDTLVIRLFDESADEEIALERSELDVAVFWPGELSSAIRGVPDWTLRLARPLRGVVVGSLLDTRGNGAGARPDVVLRDFEALDRDVFHGDLGLWNGDTFLGPDSTVGRASQPRIRFEVDSTCPGKGSLERYLNHGRKPASHDNVPVFHISYADSPTDFQRPFTSRAYRSDDSPLVVPRLMVFRPALLRLMTNLGPNEVARILDCRPITRPLREIRLDARP